MVKSSFFPNYTLLVPLFYIILFFASESVDAATTLKLSRHKTSHASGPLRQVHRRALERKNLAERAIHIPMHPHSRPHGKRNNKKRQDAAYSPSTTSPTSFPSLNSINGSSPNEAADVIVSQVTRTRTKTIAASASTAQPTSVNNPPSSFTPTVNNTVQTPPSSPAQALVGDSPEDEPDLALDNSGGLAYTIDVEIGGIAIPVIVDTGSSVFWVSASNCETCKQGGMTISNLVVPDQCQLANITYGIGSAEGCYAHGAVNLGPYVVPDVEMMGVTSVDQALSSSGSVLSGILGLAGETNNGQPTLVKVMFDTGLIQTKTVGFYLSEDENVDSEVTFGDITTSEHADPKQKVTLQSIPNDMNLYEVQMDSLTISGQSVSSGKTVIIDTGSSYIYVPEEDAKSIYSQLPSPKKSDSGYLLPCSPPNNSTLPILEFSFGEMTFDLEYRYLIGSKVDSEDGYCWAKIGTLQDMDTWVIGDAFLHTVYTSFDLGTKEVTLYKLK
ncbi:uncharacterized protein L201_005728 [Kwoniella dendrophila CBS 6074]|uniref:Peptidase A1 domain-containing protein n=1 Tax=Kwoniella dendrophila CBS 6074 TaxID=1295534 RepID=A0AAX4JZ82_9TREE